MKGKDKVKLKWKVDPEPTGRYRSFSKRGWPSAEYPGEEPAVRIECEDGYKPYMVKEGSHKELFVRIADHSVEGKGFTWKTLAKRYKTLKEAKEAAELFLYQNPEFQPKPKPKPQILKFDCVMEIDQGRGVIYVHSKEKGHTLLRICSLPSPIPNPSEYGNGIDITHMNGCSWKVS